jgi:excinuclease ABC subunit A
MPKARASCCSPPLHLPEGRTFSQQLDILQKEGFSRLTRGEQLLTIEDALADPAFLEKGTDETFLVIDRLTAKKDKQTVDRLMDSARTALYEGNDTCRMTFVGDSWESEDFSMRFEADGITFEEPSDQLFSFNSPAGACPTCEGFGRVIGIDENLVIPDSGLSVVRRCRHLLERRENG